MSPSLHHTWAGHSLCAYYCSSPWRDVDQQLCCRQRHRRRHVSVSIMYPVDISPLSCICIMYRHHAAISGELTRCEDRAARFHHHCYQTQMRQIYGTKFPSLFRATQHTTHNTTQHTTHSYPHPHILSDMKEFVLMKSVNIKLDNRPDELHCILLLCVLLCLFKPKSSSKTL